MHKVYVGTKIRGSKPFPWGRCLCGAVLDDQSEIDGHRKLEGPSGDEKNFGKETEGRDA